MQRSNFKHLEPIKTGKLPSQSIEMAEIVTSDGNWRQLLYVSGLYTIDSKVQVCGYGEINKYGKIYCEPLERYLMHHPLDEIEDYNVLTVQNEESDFNHLPILETYPEPADFIEIAELVYNFVNAHTLMYVAGIIEENGNKLLCAYHELVYLDDPELRTVLNTPESIYLSHISKYNILKKF